ncbi:MAG: HD-GYP domain-containing protein [Pirellulaceae bacterium]
MTNPERDASPFCKPLRELDFFRERMGSSIQVCERNDLTDLVTLQERLGTSLLRDYLKQVPASIDWLKSVWDGTQSVQSFQLNQSSQLTLSVLPTDQRQYDAKLLAVVQGPKETAERLVASCLESFKLDQESKLAQAALNESAMQLAQSYEEQNWLRGFARNATQFSSVASTNEIAKGILQPLCYLLRAQDLFLIVPPEETERSGLVSTSFGESDYKITTLLQVLESFQFGEKSPPLVRNNLSLSTPEGIVASLVAIPVGDRDISRGFIVGVNRCAEMHPNGTPVYDSEFGSGDVGLLEEASVLLSTQAQNMHLLLQSNQLFLGTLKAMSSTIDARDPYTQGHSERVARLSFDLAQLLGLSSEASHEIYLSGVLHDIGKIGIPDSVLLKPGKLTDDEFDTIKQHPSIGHRIVERLGHLQFTLPGVLHHHERWDGAGYPHGLQGQAIPLMARVMAVADAFDAMTSSRPYRTAMPISKASAIINQGAYEQWDGEIVECFNCWLKQKDITEQSSEGSNSVIPINEPMEQLSEAVMSLLQ